MYSKSKGFTYQQQTVLTPPPGYDGSRFRQRSDGRDDTFPLYENQSRSPKRILTQKGADDFGMEHEHDKDETCEKCDTPQKDEADMKAEDTSPITLLAPVLKRIGKEELLIIALIIILAGEKERLDTDTILLLALLLCAG